MGEDDSRASTVQLPVIDPGLLPSTEPQPKVERVKKKRKKRAVEICSSSRWPSVRRAARALGMVEVEEGADWSIYWTDGSVSIERCMAMKKHQRINHFPGMAEISRKDLLNRNLSRMRKLFPKEYSFFPQTWALPGDLGVLKAHLRAKKRAVFICKPKNSAMGKGIFLTRRPLRVLKESKKDKYIVQQYVQKPMLINGYKFDLRVYALVTACDPLRIYVFREGLARFATVPYTDPSYINMDESFMHLTNYSINKHSKDFIQDSEQNGSKRKLETITQYLADKGMDVDKMWRDIDDLIVKTLISAHPVIQHNYRTCFPSHSHHSACFEILGFDILVDRKLKSWLLEVNHSPSFQTGSAIDKDVKDSLLYDTMKLLHIRASDKQAVINEDKRLIKLRLDPKIKKKTSEIFKDKLERSAKEILTWEGRHLGGFRRIYPPEEGDDDPYAKYFEKTASLYQTTAATKAREEAIKLERLEREEKAKELSRTDCGESTLRKNPIKVRPRIPPSSRSLLRCQSRDHKVRKNEWESHGPLEGTGDAHCASEIPFSEEIERKAEMDKRTELLRGLGVIDLVHRILHCTQGTVSNYSPSVSLQYGSRQINPYHRPCVDLKCPVRRARTNHPLLKIDTRAPPNLKVINSGLVRTSSFLVQQIETARSKKVTQCQNFQIRARSRPQTGPHSNVITLP